MRRECNEIRDGYFRHEHEKHIISYRERLNGIQNCQLESNPTLNELSSWSFHALLMGKLRVNLAQNGRSSK